MLFNLQNNVDIMPENIFNHLKNLEQFKNTKTAIITDVDGTLSEIVPSPDDALVDDEMKRILKNLARKFKFLIFITGRTIENVRIMVDIPGAYYIGNHGMEYQVNNKIVFDPKVDIFRKEIGKIEGKLKKKLNLPGLIFENKNTCLTVHYRMSENQDMARISILNEIRQLNLAKELKVTEGKKVIEIKPQIGNNKGTIIRSIVKDKKLDQVIYCGDDTTDIDAFRAIETLNNQPSFKGISIVILSKETPVNVANNAQYYVNNISELKSFFNWLME